MSATCAKPDRGRLADEKFDRWLSWRLHDAYDSVLKEQLPAELDHMMRLLGARLEQDGAPCQVGSPDTTHHNGKSNGRDVNGVSGIAFGRNPTSSV